MQGLQGRGYGKGVAVQSGLSAGLNALRQPAALAVLAGLALAAGLFQLAFGWDWACAGAAVWRDPPGALAGALAVGEAIFREPWVFPLTTAPRMPGPEPTLAVGAGAAPWMIAGLKALALDGAFNPLGLGLALAWLAQPVAMVLLLHVMGARRWSVLAAGAGLALLLVPWLAPQPSAPAASGHAVVILALAVAVASARRGLTPGRVLMFCGLIAAAMGLHTAHAAPVAALFAAAAVSEIAQHRARAAPRAAEGALRLALAAAAAAFLLSGGIGPAALSPRVAAPVYPGIGVLLALLVAIGLTLRAQAWPERAAWRRFAPLAAALAGLAAFELAGAQLSGPPGRLRLEAAYLEAPAYAALALALVAIETGWRRWTPAALALALAVQAVDAAPVLTAGRRVASPAVKLDGLDASAWARRAWLLTPACRPQPGDRGLMDRLSLAAVRGGGVARRAAGCELRWDMHVPAGPHDPRITVLMDEAAMPPGRDDCRRLAGFAACGRGLTPRASAAQLDQAYVESFAGGRNLAIGPGWGPAEPTGVWSSSRLAGLLLLMPTYAEGGIRLEFDLEGYPSATGEPRRVAVAQDNARRVRWQVRPGPGVYRLDSPRGLARPGERLALEFYIDNPAPVGPAAGEPRALGVFLKQVRVSPLAGGRAAP
ncbi:MAG: hypothetical protein IT546_14595 [Caulobacteraceae bacterium]|nr:hypothetical protein [Caulobacteraceae bacterium]